MSVPSFLVSPYFQFVPLSSALFFVLAAVNRDKSDDPELSLAQGVGELQTQHSLHAAFVQVSAIPNDPNGLEPPSSSQGAAVGRAGSHQGVGGDNMQSANQRTQQRGERIP